MDDRSATRGTLSPRGLYVFSHADAFGSAPAHTLTERVRVTRVNPDGDAAPRSFSDYVVTVDESDLPSGVSVSKLIG